MKSLTALISCLALGSLLLLISVGWRYAWSEPVLFESRSGEWLSVTARDLANRPIAQFMVPGEPVRLPAKNIRLDITAPYRLSSSRTINIGNPDSTSIEKSYYLDALPTHDWTLDNISWYQVISIARGDQARRYGLALTNEGIVLFALTTGKTLWVFKDAANTAWGDTGRGCPASFQPDRCVIVPDSNGNQCQEIILAHPKLPELLCLDSSSGERLWQSNLLQSAGIPTANALTLCPIAFESSAVQAGEPGQVNVVLASHLNTVAGTNDRWLVNVDATTGKSRWAKLSNQSITANNTATQGPVPNSVRPVHLQWGTLEERPQYFSSLDNFHYRDGYWHSFRQSDLLSVLEQNVRLGTDRPFTLTSRAGRRLHWIDGSDWHIFDPETVELKSASKLPDDCVKEPKLLRVADGRTFLLTSHMATRMTDFIAWDVETQKTVWKQSMLCELDRLPQSYLSRGSDFPIVADFDGDNVDEWIAPSFNAVNPWDYSMTPPYGMVMLHRGDNGSALWEKPFHLPNMDGMIERGSLVPDADGDGWKDLLLGSRFWGGGIRDGVACFVDLVSGKTGQRIWHAQVRTESNQFTTAPIELVDLRVIEERQLIAVVTHAGTNSYSISSARPYSTTFLNLNSGQEEAFALGVKASAFEDEVWIEQRLPPVNNSRWQTESPPSQLFGWRYPNHQSASINGKVLWTANVHQIPAYGDLDKDSYPEVLAHTASDFVVEYSLLDGRTGLPRWKKRTERDLRDEWFALNYDVNHDKVDDLAVLMTPNVDESSSLKSQVQIVSGSNGKTIWKHALDQSGSLNYVLFFPGDAEQKPLLLTQNYQDKSVTCFDLGSQRIAWTSDQFKVDVTQGAIPSTLTPSLTTSHATAKQVWFSIARTSEGDTANFVDAASGEFLLQFALSPKASDDATTIEKVIQPQWVTFEGRELLAIQVLTRRPPAADSSDDQYRIDVWLVDKSIQQAGHWFEITSGPDSPAFNSWLVNADAASPTVVRTQSGQERLAVQSIIDGSCVFRLLKFDQTDEAKLLVDRTVDLSIPPSSNAAFAWAYDCDNDGFTDYLKFSDAGVDCVSGLGGVSWHRSLTFSKYVSCSAMQRNERRRLLVDALDLNTVYQLDARTGEDCPELQVENANDLEMNSANPKDKEHATWLKVSYTQSGTELTVIQRGEAKRNAASEMESDPRYLRLLPWVVNANQLLEGLANEGRNFTWPRLLKLTLGVFIVPAFVLWHCLRKRISLRQLLLLATVTAVAMSLVIKEKSAHPSVDSYNGYVLALLVSFSHALQAFFVCLPLWQIAKGGWRRRLSLSLYAALLLIIPIFTLLSNPAGVIPTTYISHRWWYVFGLALLPTGMILFVILGIAYLYRAIRRSDRRVDDKKSLVT